MENKAAIEEVCAVEGNDDLHDYGGPHGNKGNDFARFWLIDELIRLSQAGTSDFLFLLEYVQDIARLNVVIAPFGITFYQVKKREGSPWDLRSLAGLTKTGTTVKPDSPLAKLLKALFSIKSLTASAEFISNSRYKVDLESGETSLSLESVCLSELTSARQTHIGDSTASAHSVDPTDVPLGRVRLRYVPIEVNDMRTHVIGTAHGFLKAITPEHAAQADAFVDALFARLATASRHTSKCKSWDELISKRGYGREQFEAAVAALKLLPDQRKQREDLLEELAESLQWHSRERMKIEVALTDLVRLKVLGTSLPIDATLRAAIGSTQQHAADENWSAEKEFIVLEAQLTAAMNDETLPRIRALVIYLMVEAWTDQTYASSSGH